MPNSSSVTALLHNWRQGDAAALNEVAAMVDRELRRLAASYLRRERSGHTLEPTALVNEVYVRLIGQNEEMDWQSRSHFLAIAAQHMRQILVDYARRHAADKRGGGVNMVPLEDVELSIESRSANLLALDHALEELAKADGRKARVIELKYFGGLQMTEIAGVLGISVGTVEKDVRIANAWLRAALGASGD
jgi:RNA polymerase sigma factor (TIGR02999 family)